MEVEKKINKDMQKLYMRGVSERLHDSNLLRRPFGKINAWATSTGWPFPVIGTYLERINKSMGEEAVVKASRLISLFDRPFTCYRTKWVSLDLARIAEYSPESFDISVNYITTIFKTDGPAAASKMSSELGFKAVTETLLGKVSDDALLVIKREISDSHGV